ncbi:MAG: glucosamine-6-phosphate deaminase [Candidatus Omnitrophica bacterium]|nr:glucosamine-6-phosphate deaminase [Candidatus Omnitrophota bacterium]
MAQEKTFNKIKVIVAKDYKEMSRLAADLILSRIRSKKKINLLLPAGDTPKGVYSILSKQPEDLLKKVVFFNFDEYCQNDGRKRISEDNPLSYRYFMKRHLFNNIRKVKDYFANEENIKQEGAYDRKIKTLGGIDLCLDTLGRDGHTFGFNFPGTSFDSVSRRVKMNKEIKRINEKKTGYKTPDYALTTGIKTGMQSKEILFLASGKEKADIIRKVIYAKKPTTKIPATVLRLHPNCCWIIDEDAASKLQ